MSTGPSKVATQWSTGKDPVPVRWMRQFTYFSELYAKIRNIPGDIVECGVGEGNTLSMLAYLAGRECETNQIPKRALWGFDSFEGFPEPSPFDASPRDPKGGEWQIGEHMVTQRLSGSGITREFPKLSITLVKGFLRDTLPNFSRGNPTIAFLHVDVDLYEGYRDALAYLFPHVAIGGVVAFDEYKEFPQGDQGGAHYDGTIEKWPGCTRAVNAHFAGRRETITLHLETKKYFVIKAY